MQGSAEIWGFGSAAKWQMNRSIRKKQKKSYFPHPAEAAKGNHSVLSKMTQRNNSKNAFLVW